MQLSEFTSLIAQDSNSAKTFFKYLLHTHKFLNKEVAEKAILSYFNSLPEEYKVVENFPKDFNIFFSIYGVKDETYSLYEKYVTDKSIQQIIRNKNPQFNWPDEDIEFTLPEYAKTMNILGNTKPIREKIDIVLDFINKTDNQLKGFIETDKDKVIENLGKLHIINDFITQYYQEAKAFFKQYDIELVELLKYSCCTSENGFTYLLDKFLAANNDDDIEDFLTKVVANKKTLFEDDFFIQYDKIINDSERNDKHVVYSLVNFIEEDDYHKAYLTLLYFNDEIKSTLELLGEVPIINQETIKKIFIHCTGYDIFDHSDGHYQQSLDQFVNYYKTITSHNNLEKKLNDSNKSKSKSKNKI